MFFSIQIFAWIIGLAAIAVAGLYLLPKRLPDISSKETLDFVIAAVTIVGTLISVVLGMMVSSAADHYRALEESVDREATNVATIYRLTRALPETNAKKLQELCVEYCDVAINEEWPAMQRGDLSNNSSDLIAKLNDAILEMTPTDSRGSTVQSSLLEALNAVSENRRARAVAVGSNWVSALLPVLFICTGVVLCSAYLFVNEQPNKMHVVLIALVATALGANLGMLVMMSKPFSDTSGITPRQFKINEAAMKRFGRSVWPLHTSAPGSPPTSSK